jgi:alcohol dehydrogenase class IV
MQQVVRGVGSLRRVPDIVASSGLQRRVLVLCSKSLEQEACVTAVAAALPPGTMLRSFATRLLTLEEVVRSDRMIRGADGFDVIVAMGGGSVQDLAKCLRLLNDFELEPSQLTSFTRPVRKRSSIHIAVPTTAGTGSEATAFAVVYRDSKKYSVELPELLPDTIVLDPVPLRKLPSGPATFAAMDALAQAMESVWSVQATEESVKDALAAATGIFANVDAFLDRRDDEVSAAMLSGAWLSGRAINASRTTLAHALSYPLTARFGIPHGLAVFLNIPGVIRFNAGISASDCLDPRGVDHYQSRMRRLFDAIGVSSHEELAAHAERFLVRRAPAETLELFRSLDERQREAIVREALRSSRSGNNPRNPESFAIDRLPGEGE